MKKWIPIPVGRPLPQPGMARAPLRRSLPARATVQRRVPTAWLLVGAAVVLFDIEFGLAWLLHLAAGLLD
jgi:hypothetical protein